MELPVIFSLSSNWDLPTRGFKERRASVVDHLPGHRQSSEVLDLFRTCSVTGLTVSSRLLLLPLSSTVWD